MNQAMNNVITRIEKLDVIEKQFDKQESKTTKTPRRKKRRKSIKTEEASDGSKDSSVLNVRINPAESPNGTSFRKRGASKQINLSSFASQSGTYESTTSTSYMTTQRSIKEAANNTNLVPLHLPKTKNDKKTVKANENDKSPKLKKKGKSYEKNGSPSNSTHKKGMRKRTGNNLEPELHFSDYLSREQVDFGLANGTLIKGVIRINPKFYTDAYVSRGDRSLQDYYIGSVLDRNRALEGDVVVLELKPKNEWRDEQMKAKVVYILEKVHPRIAVGYLSIIKDKQQNIASFQPRDKRIPHMNILECSLPQGYFKHSSKYEKILFMAQAIDWSNPKFATGMIMENIGKSDDLKSETKAILLENQVNIEPFPAKIQKFLPITKLIPPKEFTYRKDLRKECIFTIDPVTARDLDDAVSCRRLPNGNFEVGVHIADVTYHLIENSPLDELVRKKGTSTYLVDNVYHMLPPELCMHCSLLPGRDNLTISVIWEMDKDARIVSKQFTRSIINSCVQLAYENAQYIIENPDSCHQNQLPFIHNGFEEEVCNSVKDLQSLAVKLRNRRLQNGALRIDQVKLGFNLDQTGFPTNFYIQQMKDANRLIEEFMLLANISVAERLYSDFPALAFLRCHEIPNNRMLKDVKNSLEIVGIHLDISSSKELHSSITKYNVNDYLGFSRFVALNHLLAKAMTRARYFCANQGDPETFHHYALSTPIYTHFTSPIRRYADIMVHRLLSATLGYTDKPDWDISVVQEIAEHCNKQKYNAKKAGEASGELYLAHYVDKNQPFNTDAVVISVQEKAFDAITIQTGTVVRIYTNTFEEDVAYHMELYGNENKKLYKMNVMFPPTKELPRIIQVIEIFQIIQVQLKRKSKSNKLEATLLRPAHIKVLPNII